MAASHKGWASMKTKVDSSTALTPTRRGSTPSNTGACTQRIRKERQNSSSITGTSRAAPSQRTAISGHSSRPCSSTGMNGAAAPPICIHGASRWIHSTNTTRPTTTDSSAWPRLGRFWRASSP